MNRHAYNWSPDNWKRYVTEPVPALQLRMARQREIINQVISGIAATRVLDAGCGYGRFVGILLDQFPRAEIIGCDSSPSMVRACNDSFLNQGRFTAQIADLSKLPFGDGAFDLVLCISVLMNVADERASLKELCRVLTAGGSLLFSFNNLLSPYSIPMLIRYNIIKLIRGSVHVPKYVFRTYPYFLHQLHNSGMKVSGILTDSILCIDLSLRFMRRQGLYLIPKWVLPVLGPLDHLLTNSPLKFAGSQVFVLARKVSHEEA